MEIRYIAHITIEAVTPLKVGSNSSDFLQDSPIQRDWNGLPMILGTSIAGVLRKDFDRNDDEVFGKDEGSKVIFSNALLLDEKQEVNEGLLLEKSAFLQLFDNLPIREHTAITDKGVAKEHSKFDEEVVYKGSRFKFSIEMLDNQEAFDSLLKLLQSPSFRLGGGSTKGFGKFKVVNLQKITLESVDDLLNYSSSLNSGFRDDSFRAKKIESKTHVTYTLKITPDDFFMFGSGFGDNEADQTPVYEKVIHYDEENSDLSEEMILLPASSIKGALAHRTTYHYNLQNKLYIGNSEARESIVELFGEAKQSDKELGRRGKILFSDCFKSKSQEKVFDHVAIDRFTGGGIDGALFQEKTIGDSRVYEIEILVEKGIDKLFVKAFEQSLDDVCSGMLALGGATTKGHGIFSGTWSKS